MIKADEKQFSQEMLERCSHGGVRKEIPRAIWKSIGMPPKRAYYLLGKWDDKGYYEYGVSIDTGWLTDAGLEAFGVGIHSDN